MAEPCEVRANIGGVGETRSFVHLPTSIDTSLSNNALTTHVRLVVREVTFEVHLRVTLNVPCLRPVGIAVNLAEFLLVK